MNDEPTRRLRLLKVLVQPVFVIDDDETLTERIGQGIDVPARPMARVRRNGLRRR